MCGGKALYTKVDLPPGVFCNPQGKSEHLWGTCPGSKELPKSSGSGELVADCGFKFAGIDLSFPDFFSWVSSQLVALFRLSVETLLRLVSHATVLWRPTCTSGDSAAPGCVMHPSTASLIDGLHYPHCFKKFASPSSLCCNQLTYWSSYIMIHQLAWCVQDPKSQRVGRKRSLLRSEGVLFVGDKISQQCVVDSQTLAKLCQQQGLKL